MSKLLLSAAVILLMAACNDQTENVSSSANSDSSGVSAANSQEEKEERNKQTALASVNSISAGNVDSALKDVATEFTEYGEGSTPAIKNIDTLRAGMKSFLEAFPDYKGDNFMAAADGDYVYVYADWTGTFKKDFMGIKATGKTFKVKDVDIFKFNDKGEIDEHKAVQAWATIMSQLGAKPPQK